MKKLLILFAIVGLSSLYSSCDNELNVIAEFEDIPVVYAMLNLNDTAHYIRVEKAFVDPTTAATELALDPSNLYYDNAQVQVKNLRTEETYTFTRVDGNNEGFPRDEGAFAQSPNYLYKYKPTGAEVLGNGGDALQFILNRGDELEVVTAETRLVSDLNITKPEITPNVNTIRATSTFDIRTRFDLDDAFLFDVYVILNIKEKAIDGTEWVDKSLSWNIGRNLEPEANATSPNLVASVAKGAFLNYLASTLEADPNIVRTFSTLDIRVDAAGAELQRTVELGRVNSGITSSQVTPSYTNLSEGEGIFSSRNSAVSEGFFLHSDSRDSLRNSPTTAALQFQ